MNEALRESLKLGRKLRKKPTVIECRAIVEFKNGSNWQPLDVDIHPNKIDEEGYVEEV